MYVFKVAAERISGDREEWYYVIAEDMYVKDAYYKIAEKAAKDAAEWEEDEDTLVTIREIHLLAEAEEVK